MKLTKEEKVKRCNRAINTVAVTLRGARWICEKFGGPFTKITFRVLPSGETRMHVTYAKRAKA